VKKISPHHGGVVKGNVCPSIISAFLGGNLPKSFKPKRGSQVPQRFILLLGEKKRFLFTKMGIRGGWFRVYREREKTEKRGRTRCNPSRPISHLLSLRGMEMR